MGKVEASTIVHRYLPNFGWDFWAGLGTLQAVAGEAPAPQGTRKGKGQSDFSDWPLFMPATTYSPTHFRVQ